MDSLPLSNKNNYLTDKNHKACKEKTQCPSVCILTNSTDVILYLAHMCVVIVTVLILFVLQVIRRRIVLPSSLENETPPLKVTLTKRNRKDGK